MNVSRDGFAQGQNAGGRRITVMTIFQRADRGFDNMRRGGKIRLTNAQIDNILAAGCQVCGAGQHGKGIFFADPVKAGNCCQRSHC